MSTLTTHVLDVSAGKPAAGLTVRLEALDSGRSSPIAEAITDAEGRVREWIPEGIPAGRYRLVFQTGAWFRAAGRATLYPEVVIHLELQEGERHYHIPLLLAPFGFSTYRGS